MATTIFLLLMALLVIAIVKREIELKNKSYTQTKEAADKYDVKKPIEKVEEKNEIHPLFGGTIEIDDVEYEVKMNRYCEYELVPKKKSDVAILCEKYEKLNKQKEKLEEKKQLLLDRAGVQLTIDDWTKQQAKDKERQEAIDAIKNKDGQISFFNEITEEQIQEQISENKRKELDNITKRHEELMKRVEESRRRMEELLNTKEIRKILNTEEIKANSTINPLNEPVAETKLHKIMSISRTINYKGEIEYHARTDKYLLVWNPTHFNYPSRKLLKNEFVEGKNLWKKLANQELADTFMNKCRELWETDFSNELDL